MSALNDPSVKKVIKSWSAGTAQSTGIALGAILLACLLNTFSKVSPVYLFSLEVLSLVLAASTVFGTSDVISWSRVTPAEQLEKRLLHWMTRATLFFSTLTFSLWYFLQSLPVSG
jgi:hypothetical protein